MTNLPNWRELSQRLPSLEAIRNERARRSNEKDTSGNIQTIRQKCKRLREFVELAWPILEPTTRFIYGWHIDAICEHLEAVTAGRINRLLINVPPGCSKSLIVSVMWPAWEWGPIGLASLRYLTTSYSDDYAKRDARRMRDLINSEWYQGLWGDRIKLVRAAETSFANTATGNREAQPFGSLTGGRGDRVILDDPHSTEMAESDADRARTTRIFRESLPLRLNDPVRSAIVIIMQRLHENDVSGVAIALRLGYVHLMLPMEFEPERRCETLIGFRDPRTQDGELLCPERFPRAVVERDKIPLGSYGVASQFQQRPAPRGGLMFKRYWFDVKAAAPGDCRWVRGWDLAASDDKSKGAAYTAGVKLGYCPRESHYYIGHVARERVANPEQMIVRTATQDGKYVEVSIPQDPGGSGKIQARSLVAALSGFNAHSSPEGREDKATRAMPIAAQAEAGNVSLVQGEWNEPFLNEIEAFPVGQFKDQVDALSRAFGRFIQTPGPAIIVPIVVTSPMDIIGSYHG